MVRRPSDDAYGVVDRLAEARARDDELARAQGRGSTALRDSAGNVLLMNADAPYPLLRPMGVDASMAFSPEGTVKIMSPDTLEDRDMTVRDIASSGRMDAQFLGTQSLGANEIGVGVLRPGAISVPGTAVGLDGGGINAGPNLTSRRVQVGRVNIEDAGIATPGVAVGGTVGAGRVQVGPVNIDPNGIASPGIAVGGTVGARRGSFDDLSYGRLVPHSAERLKHDRRPLQRTAALSAVASIAWDRWRYRASDQVSEEQAAQEHIGPMADELAAHPLLSSLVVRNDDGDIEGYELTSLVGVLGKAVADLAAEVADLRRQVDSRPTARYPWEPGWTPAHGSGR